MKFKLFDYVNIGYYFLSILIVLFFYMAIPKPNLLIAIYLTLIISSVYIIKNENKNRYFLFLRYFYPFIFVSFVFESLGFIVPFINPHNKDYILVHADRFIFGKDLCLILNFLNVRGITDYLQLSYITYYFLPLFLAIYLYKKHKTKLLDQSLFAIFLGYYVSYLGYMAIPAVGPRYTFAYLSKMPLHGWYIYDVIHPMLNALEDIKQDCFPSGHVELSLLTLLLFKDINRKVSLIILPIVLSLILSTVALRYHYGTDVIFGILIAFLIYYFSKFIYKN